MKSKCVSNNFRKFIEIIVGASALDVPVNTFGVPSSNSRATMPILQESNAGDRSHGDSVSKRDSGGAYSSVCSALEGPPVNKFSSVNLFHADEKSPKTHLTDASNAETGSSSGSRLLWHMMLLNHRDVRYNNKYEIVAIKSTKAFLRRLDISMNDSFFVKKGRRFQNLPQDTTKKITTQWQYYIIRVA